MSEVVAFNSFQRFLTSIQDRVRHVIDPETGRPMNHVYEYLQALGMAYKAATEQFKRFKEAHPELSRNIGKLKFDPVEGQRQNHPSWAADAETLYALTLTLKPEYSQPFRDFATKTASLALGGSVALQQAVGEMHEFQQTLPEDHPMRVFGREAEHVDIQSAAISMGDPRYLHRRVRAADFFLDLRAAVIRKMPRANSRGFWTELNGMVSNAVLGKWPAVFREEHDIVGGRSARDFMTRAQLSVVDALEDTLLDAVDEYAGTDGTEFLKLVRKLTTDAYEAFSRLHGKYQEPTHLPDVREAHEASVLARANLLQGPAQPRYNTINATTVNINQYS